MADTKVRISAETAQAEAALKALGNGIIGLRFNLTSLAGVLGGAISVGAFGSFIKKSIDLQDELGSLSAKTGIAAKDLGGLKFAAEQNGTSLEVVSKAVKELSINMSATPDKFAKLGINATTATGALTQIADLVETMPDGMQKTALLAELMGKKVGPEMAEFLSQGGNALREYIAKGQGIYKVTNESAAAAKEFKDQMAELEARTDGVGVSIANYFLPALNDLTFTMNQAAKEGGTLHGVLVGLGGLMGRALGLDMSKSQLWILKDQAADLGEELDSLLSKRNTVSNSSGIDKWLDETFGFGSVDELTKKINVVNDKLLEVNKQIYAIEEVETTKPGKPKKPKTVPKAVSDLLGEGTKKPSDGTQVLLALELDYQNTLAKRRDALNAPLLSSSEKALADDLREVHKRAQDARVALEKQKASQGDAFKEYQTRIDEVTAKEREQADAVKALQAAQDQLNGSWEYGAKVAMRNYIDEAQNTAKLTEHLFGNAFKGMGDALVNFVQTGKLDFKSLVDSIIADIIRMQVQQAQGGILKAIFGAVTTGGNGGGAGSGYGDTAGVAAGVPSYDGGGFTGASSRSGGLDGKGGFMAIMHPNETVIDHTRGKSSGGIIINYAPSISIDARSDSAQIEQMVSRQLRQSNAELVDQLQRQGAI